MNTNSKHWFFTWYSYEDGVKLPTKSSLIKFFKYTCDHVCFQKERGKIAKKLHWQGCLTLTGVRQSKKSVLELFKYRFKNVSGLTLSRTQNKEAAESYVTKTETRVSGPWYVGSSSYRRKNSIMTIKLRKWQQQLLNELKGPLAESLRDRKVTWVQDLVGGCGKSTFLKFLRFGQSGLIVRKLPLDRPDRLRMFVCKVAEQTDIDVFAFDFTRTLDDDTSIKSLFQIIEELKNGYIVSAMFGKPLEILIDSPFVLIFTNEDISSYFHYLSMDRWCAYEIRDDDLLKIRKTPGYSNHDLNSRYITLN